MSKKSTPPKNTPPPKPNRTAHGGKGAQRNARTKNPPPPKKD